MIVIPLHFTPFTKHLKSSARHSIAKFGNAALVMLTQVVVLLLSLLVAPISAQQATFGGTFFNPPSGFVNDAEIRSAGTLTVTIDLRG